MKKSIQRMLCAVLLLVMIACIVPVSSVSASAEDRLSGINKTIYDFLKTQVTAVANGAQTSTEFKLTNFNANLKWTSQELGVSAIFSGGKVTPEADAAFNKMFKQSIDIDRITNTLLAECPYEMYWYDKVTGVLFGWTYSATSNEMMVTGITFKLAVSADYASGTYTTNPTKIAAAVAASNNAKAIVARHAGKSDWEKLVAYKNEICQLVSYNHAAADNNSTPYGNPWQLISVFDNNSATNVVCEGYAKAFKYLCDLTDFDGKVECYLVDGQMQGGTGAGAHMWNVVTYNGGALLVDVTNCDEGSIGETDKLFMKVGQKNGDWYAFNCGSNTIYYTYSPAGKDLHTDGYLELKPIPDQPPEEEEKEAASITTQPKTQKIKAGSTAKFTVKATGSGLKYQWQTSADGKVWKNCSSSTATKASFSFTSKTSHNGNYYRCVITDSLGNTVHTDAVRLYVLGITTQPKTLKIKAGTTAKLTVKATGTGLKYQWQSSSNGKSWKNCSSGTATKASFSFTSKTSHNGNYYRCKVTDSAGNTVYTDVVRLYVLGVTTQPKTQKVEAGDAVKFTVKATGSGLKYQWQYSTDGKTWKNCSSTSATKTTFSFTGKTSHNGNYYRCKVTDSAGNVIYTSTVRLYVLGITEQPVSKTVTKGKTAKFTVEATGASKLYQWQVSTDGGKTWKNCSSSSAKKATFSFTAKTSHSGNYYRCRIKDSGGNTVYTSKVKLTVKK